MDTVEITMLADVGEMKKGESYQLDKDTAEKLIAAGLAEVAEPAEEGKIFDKFQKALDERDSKIVNELSKTLRNVTVKAPSVSTIEDNNPDTNFFVLVGKTQSKDSRVREKAYNTLANKYGQKTNMSEGTTTDGGFLVPTVYAKELLKVEGYEGVAYPGRVNVVPMSAKVINYPALDQTVTPSAGSSAFYGGISIGVVAEGNAPAANTQPAFKQVTLTARKALATCQVTQELLDDSPISVEKIINDGFRRAAGAWIDYEIFNGGGGSTELTGIIDHDATLKVTRAKGGTVGLTDFAEMWASLAPQSRKNAVWVVNPMVWSAIPTMGSPNHLVWLVDSGVQQDFVLKLFGRPILDSEALPALGNAGDVLLVDLKSYLLGLHTDVVIDASPHYAFPQDMITYRLRFRLDGKPQLTAPIKLQDGQTEVSPLVQLDVSAS